MSEVYFDRKALQNTKTQFLTGGNYLKLLLKTLSFLP